MSFVFHNASAASVFLFFSAMLCLALGVYAFRQRRDAFTVNFVALMLVSSVYAIGYGAELMSGDLATMRAMLQLQYLGIPFISLAWIGMAWGFLDIRGLPRPVLLVMLLASIAVLTAFQTNEWHHLFYQRLDFSREGGLSLALATKGPLYWAHIAYLNGGIAAGIAFFFRAWRQSMRIYRLQSLCLLLGSLFPWGFHLIYLMGWSPYQLDLGPFGLAASGVLWAIASFRHRILEILPIARDLVFDGISEGVVVLDSRAQIADFNRAAVGFIPGLSQRAIGQPLATVEGAQQIACLVANPSADGAGDEVMHREIEISLAGAFKFVELRQSSVKDRNGKVFCRMLLMLDVTEKKRLLDQLHRQAISDPLTGVFNRRQLDEQGSILFALARRHEKPLSVGIIDIDYFKATNDSQGHHAGDQVLRKVSTQIGARLRASDVLGRYGGDEFLVVLPGTGIDAAICVMHELGGLCRDTAGVTLSIGVAEITPDTADFEALVSRADVQLYLAKTAGRDQVMPPLCTECAAI